MLAGFAGFTSARGSGSAFGYSVLPSSDSWSATLSAVQPVNGLGPEAVTVDVRVYGPADAPLATTSAATPAAARIQKRKALPPSASNRGTLTRSRVRAMRITTVDVESVRARFSALDR